LSNIDELRLESEDMIQHLVASFFTIPNGKILPHRPDLLIFTLAMFNFAVLHAYPTMNGKDIQKLEDSFLQVFEELRIIYDKLGAA
jgi:hypothetical protein